jgi:hypothetical protein
MRVPSFEYVLDVMDKAKLSATEMITLLPVGRATFYNWKRGQPIRDLLRYRLTVARCNVIEQATGDGRLPLNDDIPQALRLARIGAILKETRGKS